MIRLISPLLRLPLFPPLFSPLFSALMTRFRYAPPQRCRLPLPLRALFCFSLLPLLPPDLASPPRVAAFIIRFSPAMPFFAGRIRFIGCCR